MQAERSHVLLVVESPKLAPLAEKLVRAVLGSSVKAVATHGHLFDLPVTDKADGLNPEWQPIHPHCLDRIKAASSGAACVVIATDPDPEGERIAMQARSLVGARCFRLRVHSWTRDGVAAGFSGTGLFDEPLARAAEARRIADRVIGWRFKTPGRVRAQMIAAWLREEPPFVWAQPEAEPPPDLGALLLAAARVRVRIEQASQQMAEAWLDGRSSYPRTDGQCYSEDSLKVATKIAYDQGCFPHRDGPLAGRQGSHEALLPTGGDRQDGVVLGVLRKLVAASMARRHIPGLDIGVAEKMPWDARWLHVARRDDLGRPGTWAGHIVGLAGTGFATEHGLARDRAIHALKKLPSQMVLPETPFAFESVLKDIGAGQAHVRDALAVVGLDVSVTERWSWSVAHEQHGPAAEPLVEAGL